MSILGDSFLYDGSGEPTFSALFYAYLVAQLVALTMAIVGVHRVFTMEPHAIEELGLFNWTGNEIRYVGWWILIGICATVILMLAFLVITLVGSTDNEGWLQKALMLLSTITVLYFSSRWSLVLPSSAIGKHEGDLRWSWEMSEGNGWRLTILVGGPYLLITLFDLLPSNDSIIYALLLGVVWLVAGAVQVGMISLSYVHLMQFEGERRRNDE